MILWSQFTFRRSLIICFIILAAAIAATVPVVEMPVNDDFSYSRVAFNVAETGRLIYSGWGSPIVGIQAYWAAIFIKLFGFSFQTLRFAALPFTFGGAALLQALFKRSGVNPAIAIFGVLCILLSPLAIPMEPSFMTDIPSFFFVLLAIWCSSRAIDSPTGAKLLLWAFYAIMAGLAGATIRQTVSLVLIVCIPFVAWHAKKKSHAVAVFAMLAVALAGVVSLNAWYQIQPYAVPLPLIDKANFKGWRMAAYCAASDSLEIGLLLLPALLLTVSLWRRFSYRAWAAFILSGLFVSQILWYFWRTRPYLPKIPFGAIGGNMVTQWGMIGENLEILGTKPLILPNWVQSALVALSISLMFPAVILASRAIPVAKSLGEAKALSRAHPAFLFLVLYASAYLPLILLRVYVGAAFDRYLFPILPPLVLAICMLPGLRLRIPGAAAWIALAASACLGIGITHDYFSELRGRLEATGQLERIGIPRADISAGLESDLWYEMKCSGHANDPMIIYPRSAYRPMTDHAYPIDPPFWLWPFTPSITFEYILTLSPQPFLDQSSLPPVIFSRWLSQPGRVFTQISRLQGKK
jgi:Dolichyl-phosphate-mannose-protein mannosyltransferase